MAYRGKYRPENLSKYVGDPDKITYRSLWERKFMLFCDNEPNVIEWASESVVVPYISPIDGKWHRYYVDFIVRMRESNGTIKTKLIEIKPKKQCKPPMKRKKVTRKYLTEVKRWGVNSAKWEYATQYAENRGWEFVILTEDDLNV
jgi:hypothetical protein